MWVPDQLETEKLHDARRAYLERQKQEDNVAFANAIALIEEKKRNCVEFIKRSYAQNGVFPPMPITCETYLKNPDSSHIILARFEAHYGSTAKFKSLSGHPFQEYWGNAEDYCGCETVIKPAIQVTMKHL